MYFYRYGFSTPPNYNDHELYCGGFTRQWQKNGGKCGICGDAWDMPVVRTPLIEPFNFEMNELVILQNITKNHIKRQYNIQWHS